MTRRATTPRAKSTATLRAKARWPWGFVVRSVKDRRGSIPSLSPRPRAIWLLANGVLSHGLMSYGVHGVLVSVGGGSPLRQPVGIHGPLLDLRPPAATILHRMATVVEPSKPAWPELPPRRIPPLENGAHLTAAEFLRRHQAMPEVKKSELINGVVYMASPSASNNTVNRTISFKAGYAITASPPPA